MKKKVLLLYGGYSSERNVSISSKNDLKNALENNNYEVIEHNLTDTWKLIETIKKEKPDVVYNGLYGNWGEDGEIQALLDMLQIPYTHSGMKTSVLGMDKYLTRFLAKENGVKVANGEKTTFSDYLKYGTSIPYPHVIKPICEGSSVGVYIIKQKEDVEHISYDDNSTEILVEEYIEGRELTAMCLNGKSHVVTELISSTEFYNYQAKYTNNVTKHILPAEIPEEITLTCLKYAETMHKILNCNTISRCDFRYNPKDGVVFLEINTNPGMTSLSLVPEQAKYIGISYEELCDMLVKNASYRKIL